MPGDTWVDHSLLGDCLVAAAYISGPGTPQAALLASAWQLYGVLSNPTTRVDLEVVISRNGTVTNRYSYQDLSQEEKQLMTAMTMDDTATITVSTTDDHGDATSDQLSYAASGAEVTLNVSADTKSCTVVPAAEGTGVTVTVTDSAAPNVAAFVASFDIGPGPTSAVVGNVAVNTGANVAPPPAAPPAG